MARSLCCLARDFALSLPAYRAAASKSSTNINTRRINKPKKKITNQLLSSMAQGSSKRCNQCASSSCRRWRGCRAGSRRVGIQRVDVDLRVLHCKGVISDDFSSAVSIPLQNTPSILTAVEKLGSCKMLHTTGSYEECCI